MDGGGEELGAGGLGLRQLGFQGVAQRQHLGHVRQVGRDQHAIFSPRPRQQRLPELDCHAAAFVSPDSEEPHTVLSTV